MTPHTAYATVPPAIRTMPPGIPYIIGNEAAERFSFYGMKSILVVFMTQYLLSSAGTADHMDDNEAQEWYHNFVAAVYFVPILGSVLSDWLWGKYSTILRLSMVYCLGHLVLALMEVPLGWEPRSLLLLGLALISVGSGGIKPCVSAHLGDQFGPENKQLIPRAFSMFYFSINFGSAFSTMLTPWLLDKYGPAWAFGVPGVLMGVATLTFWLGRNRFVHIPPAGNQFFRDTFSREGLLVVVNLIPLYLFLATFWALFDQTGSAWVLQAEDMDRTVWPAMGGGQAWVALPSQIQVVNPILVMAFIPLFSWVIYPFLERFVRMTPLRRVGTGLFLSAAAFAVTGLVAVRIELGAQPHIWWHLVAYVLITAGEILVSITVLEFSYTQAPPKMKSFIMGMYLLSVALGNMLTAKVNGYIQHQQEAGVTILQGAAYYWFFTGAALIAAILFLVWSPFYRGRTYIQGEQAMLVDPETV